MTILYKTVYLISNNQLKYLSFNNRAGIAKEDDLFSIRQIFAA